jgi:arylsulfatase A-like enzyme
LKILLIGLLFERGIIEHTTPVLYQGIIQIPLLIHGLGQSARQDVYALTSGVDVLPTLL